MTTAENLWFLNTLVRVLVPHGAGTDGVSVLESVAPRGDSPPLHVHHTEDEVFHVLDGELTLRLGEQDLKASAGDALLAPKGVPHTYRVDSNEARWLVVTRNGDFEAFVRRLSRAAERPELPHPAGPPTPEAERLLAATAAEHNIELTGPPLA